MLQHINRSKINNALWLFMALYLFNISVDSPDGFPQNAENLTINDQESIIEIVIEKFLGYDNLITEHDDADSEEQSLGKKSYSLSYYLISNTYFNSLETYFKQTKKEIFCKNENPKVPFFQKDSPPPEV